MVAWGQNEVFQKELEEMCNKNLPYEKLKNQRIFVTGANGLICSYLIDVLMKMNDCLGLQMHVTAFARSREKAKGRFADYLDRDDFALLLGDICQNDLYKNMTFDYIVHGAGNAHPKAFALQPVETMKGNLLGTMHLLDYAVKQEVQNPVKKIVFLSSGEIYGDAPVQDENGWVEEEKGIVDSMQVRACYPESKRAAETLCLSYSAEYDVRAVVARLGYIFGSTIQRDNTRADAQFLRNAINGEDIILKSEGKQLRSYCYLADAVQAVLLLLLEGKAGEAYNVANKECTVTIREYAENLAAAFGVKVCMELPEVETTEQKGYSKMLREIVNPEKLYQLGFKPVYSMKNSMAQMKKILKE